MKALETLYSQLEDHVKHRINNAPRGHNAGTIESLELRVDVLEDALAHLMAWTAQQFRLTTEEIEAEAGIADF